MITFHELTSKISDWEIEFLFKVLLERKYRISHDRMPSYAEHNSFVNNHPYHMEHCSTKRNTNRDSLYRVGHQ